MVPSFVSCLSQSGGSTPKGAEASSIPGFDPEDIEDAPLRPSTAPSKATSPMGLAGSQANTPGERCQIRAPQVRVASDEVISESRSSSHKRIANYSSFSADPSL